ncbi:hypothetical protein Bpfe_009067 [Biomphalaria pfeifferi]|uniref:Uncharacterized protein n=1 Tax=Biomphalaria pfeifferi TaxID=112525 RepID=A0AAD8FEQ3_BIOPF|nr:hypothetical protein Bpfe_009067 [Biomphalaria pfeifferi]
MDKLDETLGMDKLDETLGTDKLDETLGTDKLDETLGTDKLDETLRRQNIDGDSEQVHFSNFDCTTVFGTDTNTTVSTVSRKLKKKVFASINPSLNA